MSGAVFHLAFGVDDLDAARAFYVTLLGCEEGRSATRWVDFNLHGHQVVAHLRDAGPRAGGATPDVAQTMVDGEGIPVPHFGLVLDWDAWHALAERLAASDVEFLRAPGLRFIGQAGEQATLFLRDPSGNALEFKAFRDPARLFARDDATSGPT